MCEMLSRRFLFMSFVAMWMIVTIHFSFLSGCKLSSVTTHAITQWAVPWFFFVSGTFVCVSLNKQSVLMFSRKKIKGLILPFLAWCLIPAVIALVCGKGTWNTLEVVGISTPFPTYNSVLWYLRSLIGFMAVILLWHKVLVHVRLGKIVVALLFLTSLIALARAGIDFRGTPTSPLYFIVGYLLSDVILGSKVPAVGKRLPVVLFAWMLAIVLRAAWFVLGLHGAIEMLLRNACVVSMMAALWVSCDYFEFTQRKLPDWTKATFFVYCCHAPILKALAPVLSPVINASTLSSTIAYLIYVIAAPLLFFGLAAGVKKLLPRTYTFLSGGR